MTTPEDLDRITRILARLYRRYRHLARERYAWDLGLAGVGQAPEILEINQTIALEPELRETLTFSRCRALAEALLDRPVQYRFDHAIYKPAYNGRATAWHQDEAYTLDPTLVTTHFWVPVQDVSVEMGCMQFIPGSHLERGSDATIRWSACGTRTRWRPVTWTSVARSPARCGRATSPCTSRGRCTTPVHISPGRHGWRGRWSSGRGGSCRSDWWPRPASCGARPHGSAGGPDAEASYGVSSIDSREMRTKDSTVRRKTSLPDGRRTEKYARLLAGTLT